MPTKRAKNHQAYWRELCRDRSLNDLPYKVETNARGQLILTRASTQRSLRMGTVMKALDERPPEGLPLPSLAIATPEGTKVPDVVWVSPGRREKMKKTGDPPTLAPEICVEMMSESNDWEEMEEKRVLYREAGAEEMWVVDEDGNIRFFADEELEASEIVSDFPAEV